MAYEVRRPPGWTAQPIDIFDWRATAPCGNAEREEPVSQQLKSAGTQHRRSKYEAEVCDTVEAAIPHEAAVTLVGNGERQWVKWLHESQRCERGEKVEMERGVVFGSEVVRVPRAVFYPVEIPERISTDDKSVQAESWASEDSAWLRHPVDL